MGWSGKESPVTHFCHPILNLSIGLVNLIFLVLISRMNRGRMRATVILFTLYNGAGIPCIPCLLLTMSNLALKILPDLEDSLLESWNSYLRSCDRIWTTALQLERKVSIIAGCHGPVKVDLKICWDTAGDWERCPVWLDADAQNSRGAWQRQTHPSTLIKPVITPWRAINLCTELC